MRTIKIVLGIILIGQNPFLSMESVNNNKLIEIIEEPTYQESSMVLNEEQYNFYILLLKENLEKEDYTKMYNFLDSNIFDNKTNK